MNSIDKFGRLPVDNLEAVKSGRKRGPPGQGYDLDEDGNYNLNNKRLKNLTDPVQTDNVVNLRFLQQHCLYKEDAFFDAKNARIVNLGQSNDESAAVNRGYVDRLFPLAITKENGERLIIFGNRRVTDVRKAIKEDDAVTLGQVISLINHFKSEIFEKISEARTNVVSAIKNDGSSSSSDKRKHSQRAP